MDSFPVLKERRSEIDQVLLVTFEINRLEQDQIQENVGQNGIFGMKLSTKKKRYIEKQEGGSILRGKNTSIKINK